MAAEKVGSTGEAAVVKVARKRVASAQRVCATSSRTQARMSVRLRPEMKVIIHEMYKMGMRGG